MYTVTFYRLEGGDRTATGRHCEERSDAAIQWASEVVLDCFASLAMTAYAASPSASSGADCPSSHDWNIKIAHS